MAFDIASIIGSTLGDAFQKIVGSFKADPTKAMEIQGQLAQAQIEIQGKLVDQINSQIDVDKAEASNASVFVAGWRPFIGWICGLGVGTQFIVGPFFTWIASLSGHPVQFPILDLGMLISLLGGMLGLSGLRTYEKVQGAPGSDKLK